LDLHAAAGMLMAINNQKDAPMLERKNAGTIRNSESALRLPATDFQLNQARTTANAL
jgi:hypothetical protein